MTHPRWRQRRTARAVSVLAAAVTLAGTALAGTALAGQAAQAGPVRGGTANRDAGRAGAAAAVAARPAAAQARSAAPAVKLIAAQRTLIIGVFGGSESIDPGIYVASLKSALVFHVRRVSYARPITITEVLHRAGHTVYRRLPDSVIRDSWAGLRRFIRLQVVTLHGRVVAQSTQSLCPDAFNPARVSPDSALNSPYPLQCSAFAPFGQAMVWGIARGWAIDQNGFEGKLKPGTYRVIETITGRYRRLLHISAVDARASVKVKLVKRQGCCFPDNLRPRSQRHPGTRTLPALPAVPTLRNPPLEALPDLAPLPSWGIGITESRAGKHGPVTDNLNFSATVWIGGHSPLDVEGFRSHGSQIMKAYQYFWRNGRLIGRTRVGTMGFADYNRWHFRQFAQYRLLTAGKKVSVRSHKEGFCIGPTDPINLLIRRATWNPSFIGLAGECGNPDALWVREVLPIGWGDTYEQTVPGESFNITSVPNGTYYIAVIVNPLRLLHETNTRNDISLRKVILGGTRGHRTVRVPSVHGIDPEHMG